MTVGKGAPDVRRELFGGSGEVKVWQLRRGPAEPFTDILSCELAPSGSVGKHVQDQFAEIVIGLDGEGEAVVDSQRFPLGPGDVVHLPLGAVLSLQNRSATTPLHYLIIKARSPPR